jgi:hypothetical protein
VEGENMAKGKVKIVFLVSTLIFLFFVLIANRPLVGQEGQEDNFQATVKQKLEQVLSNQEKIITQIDALKEEITKARVWNR